MTQTAHRGSRPAADHAPTRLCGPDVDDVLQLVTHLHQAVAQLSLPRRSTTGSAAEQALTALLEGRGADADALLLGVPLSASRVLVIVASPPAQLRLQRHIAALNRTPATLPLYDDGVVTLVPELPKPAGESRSRHLTHVLVTSAHRAGLGTAAGASSPIRHRADLPAALDEARTAADLSPAAEGTCTFADDAWAAVTSARLRRALVAALPLANPLTAITDHDQVHGTELLTSLAAWLGAGQQARVAAVKLGVHVNTLRYRLRRAAEISGLDLDDQDTRALAHLLLAP